VPVLDGPAAFEHRPLPLLPGREHSVLAAADLRLHDLELRTDDEPEFPAELVALELTSSLAAVLAEDEEVAQVCGRAVPIWTLKDVHGRGVYHARRRGCIRWRSNLPLCSEG
jgi:hypothetical protein